jgi:tetratricopeptide (TPR) repeat protein
MTRLVLWFLVASVVPGLRAQTPDAEFLQIYSLMQEGEALERSGEFGRAYERFQQARWDLDAFAKANPSWNRRIVHFRLGYLGEKVGALRAQIPSRSPAGGSLPASSVPSGTGALHVPSVRSSAQALVSGTSADVSGEPARARSPVADAESRASAAEARADAALRTADEATARANEMRDRSARMALDLRQARDRIEVLEATRLNLDKTRERLEHDTMLLRAKLNEALRPRPAALDPAELARAEERSRLLMKENAILVASLDFEVTEKKRLIEKASKALEFEEQLRAARAELGAARREADGLRVEREKLQARLDLVTRKKDHEIADLKKEIRSLNDDLVAARFVPGSRENKEFAVLRKQLADERTRAGELRRENASLNEELNRRGAIRVSRASFTVPEVGDSPSAPDTWADERAQLQSDLAAARSERRDRDPRHYEARVRELTGSVRQLEAKLNALEARPDPYSPEELALFKAPTRRESFVSMELAQATTPPPPTPRTSNGTTRSNSPPASANQNAPPPATSRTTTNAPPAPVGSTNGTPASGAGSKSQPRRRTVNDLPPGAGQLARQAERAFTQRRFDEAERVYREILTMDENNVFTLGNLAAILVEQGRLEEGETMANRALAVDPEDPFSLSLIGIVRFRQRQYDEAFAALSRSAEIDPENADTQNYLGITLSQRGQRKAAEAALRKALKLNPSSASAHYNLAVVYATQKPPFLELARYHYQKAIRAGQPANPAFEEVLNGTTEAAGPE